MSQFVCESIDQLIDRRRCAIAHTLGSTDSSRPFPRTRVRQRRGLANNGRAHASHWSMSCV